MKIKNSRCQAHDTVDDVLIPAFCGGSLRLSSRMGNLIPLFQTLNDISKMKEEQNSIPNGPKLFFLLFAFAFALKWKL